MTPCYCSPSVEGNNPMRRLWIAAAAALASSSIAGAQPVSDPFAYMEDANGAQALAFAKAENDRSLPVLQKDPRYSANYADALRLVTAKDRIPGVSFMN